MAEDKQFKAYSSTPETMKSIGMWRKSLIRPDLFIMAPTRGVGEHELIDELAKASYEVQGFQDAMRRHFVSRPFPFTDREDSYSRFVDQAFDVSEISDGFYGVDNIDLTEWVGKSLSREASKWQRLLTYINDHPETDFVFLAYTNKEEEVHKLIKSISESCGIAVALVKLDYPAVENLVRAFVDYSPQLFAEHEGHIKERLSALLNQGWKLGYASVQASAISAAYEASMSDDVLSAIDIVFDRAVEMSDSIKQSFQVGFNGGYV